MESDKLLAGDGLREEGPEAATTRYRTVHVFSVRGYEMHTKVVQRFPIVASLLFGFDE